MSWRCLLGFGLLSLAMASLHGQAIGAEPQAAREGRFVVDPSWPRGPHGPWGALPGITLDAQDRVFLFTRTRPALQIYQADGTPAGAWHVESSDGAHQVRIAPDGCVWLVDCHTHVVERYDPHGKRLMRLGQWNVAGSDASHFKSPTDVAVLPSGDAFVTDGYGNRRVVHFDSQGRYVRQWGEQGNGPGQFALPHSIVADPENRLYVADRDNGRIQVFDVQGKLLAVWDNGIIPWGLWITPQRTIWVCGSSQVRKGTGWAVLPPPDQLALKVNLDGKVLIRVGLTKVTRPPGKPGEVDWVHSIAVDSHGAIYLGDIQGKRIQKYSIER